MPDELPDVLALRELEPPPGGLERLRAVIAADDERRSSRARWWLATAPMVAIVALLLWLRRGEPEPVPPPPVSSRPTPAVPDLTIAPNLYWVASTPGPVAAGVSHHFTTSTTSARRDPP